jgi:hypothetical protein
MFMNPLHISTPDPTCPICFDETSVFRFRFHENLLSQRVHSVCLDCAFSLYKHQRHDEGAAFSSILCPECRKVTYIKIKQVDSSYMVQLVCLVSLVFFFSKSFLEPYLTSWGRFFNPTSEYSHVIDLWTTCSPGNPLWPKVQLAIENLILMGEHELIFKELKAYQDMVTISDVVCLMSLYLAAYFKLKTQKLNSKDFQFCHRSVIAVIAVFSIYNLSMEKARYTSFKNDLFDLTYFINPLRPHLMQTDVTYLLSHASISFLAMMTSFFYSLDQKKITIKSKEDFVRAIIDKDLVISSKRF